MRVLEAVIVDSWRGGSSQRRWARELIALISLKEVSSRCLGAFVTLMTSHLLIVECTT